MLISVIIPCRNVEEYVENAIVSVINQTHTNIELVLVDNLSDDGTLRILQAYSTKYDHIQVMQCQKGGASAARNLGLSVAKGEWIQFLDADDMLHNNKIEHQCDLIKKNRNIDWIVASYEYQYLDQTSKIFHPNSNILVGLFRSELGCTCSNLFRKSALTNFTWNEGLSSHQDLELFFNLLLRNSKILFDRTPLTIVHRRKSGQISHTNIKENCVTGIILRQKFLVELTRRGLLHSPEQLIAKDIIFHFIYQLAQYSPMEAQKYFLDFLTESYLPEKRMFNYVSHAQEFLFRLLGYKTVFSFQKGLRSLKEMTKSILPN